MPVVTCMKAKLVSETTWLVYAIAKINIFKPQQLGFYQWESSKELLKNTKSITYRNLTAEASK